MITGLLCQSGTVARMCASVAATVPISRMSTSGWTRVPANSLPRVKRRSKRASRSVPGRRGPSAAAPGAVAGSTNVGPKLSSLARSTRCRRATCSHSGRPAPGCASSVEGPRRRGPEADASYGRDNPTHETGPCEPFDLHGRGSGARMEDEEGASASSCPVRRRWTSGTLLAQEPGDAGCP